MELLVLLGELSPAYDLVATIAYIPGDSLALKLSREKRFGEIRYAHFDKLAAGVGVGEERVRRIVRDTIQAAMASWPATGELEAGAERLLRAHVEGLPLVREAG